MKDMDEREKYLQNVCYEYYDNGDISGKGCMVSGEKEGRWEYSYKSDIDMNGKMEGNYVKGKKEGLWDFKARNG